MDTGNNLVVETRRSAKVRKTSVAAKGRSKEKQSIYYTALPRGSTHPSVCLSVRPSYASNFLQIGKLQKFLNSGNTVLERVTSGANLRSIGSV